MTAFLLNTNKIFPKADPINRTLCNISHFTPEYLSISLFLSFYLSLSGSVFSDKTWIIYNKYKYLNVILISW